MQTSPEINELAAALATAQGQMENATKDADNPFYKSKYADLAAVWDAIRKPLADNGLSVVQFPETVEGDAPAVRIVTLILHASGQWIRAECVFPVSKDDAQGYGSATTYGKRYMLQGMGVAPEDDDGNAAVGDYIPCSQPGCKYRASYQEGEKWFCGTHRSNRPPNAPRGTGTGPSKGGNAFQKAQDAPGPPNGPKLVETPERRFKRLLVALREVGWGEPLLVENSVEGAMARSILLQELLEGEAKGRVVPNKLLDGDWIEAANKLDAILKEQVGEPAQP